MSDSDKTRFENAADTAGKCGFFSEFWQFLASNKKWWLLPIVIVLIVFGIVIILGGTGAAPFIYTLF